tara:strand:+ start:573 stop:1088 length:516 start_codon:yes stop_codon:yes gene_type:complete
MSKQNLIEDNLELLDNCLNYLIESETLSLYFDDLRIKLINDTNKKIELSNSNNRTVDELFVDIFSKQTQKTKNLIKISEVLLYLESENLIRLIEQNHIRITYQGIIQSSKGYLKTYKSEEATSQRVYNVEQLQNFHLRWMTILTSIIAVGTLVAAVYYFFELFSFEICAHK